MAHKRTHRAPDCCPVMLTISLIQGFPRNAGFRIIKPEINFTCGGIYELFLTAESSHRANARGEHRWSNFISRRASIRRITNTVAKVA
jgi:hypothetical protein